MATLATPIRDESVYRDPSCVKVVCSARGRALYFSRSPIPCHRDGLPDPRVASPVAHLHLGLYAYRREFLLALGGLPPSRLEAAERLEQLRVLEAGYPIAIAVVEEPSIGIDTPEDYRRFVERWTRTQKTAGAGE
jgi:3-deoxy-manno-octulosonate cytidylyltransferase (CMP-KDO synthetase)